MPVCPETLTLVSRTFSICLWAFWDLSRSDSWSDYPCVRVCSWQFQPICCRGFCGLPWTHTLHRDSSHTSWSCDLGYCAIFLDTACRSYWSQLSSAWAILQWYSISWCRICRRRHWWASPPQAATASFCHRSSWCLKIAVALMTFARACRNSRPHWPWSCLGLSCHWDSNFLFGLVHLPIWLTIWMRPIFGPCSLWSEMARPGSACLGASPRHSFGRRYYWISEFARSALFAWFEVQHGFASDHLLQMR